jgi:hypothetical protein
MTFSLLNSTQCCEATLRKQALQLVRTCKLYNVSGRLLVNIEERVEIAVSIL